MIKKLNISLLFTLLSGALFAQQPSKYALVIGNAEYQRIEKLTNTINDARDIGTALKELGYQVEMKTNLTQYQFIDAVDAFAARLSGNQSSEGFFWYAGHAVQIRDENYLLPVDITIDSESRVRAGSYSLNTLLDALEGAQNKVNVIVLDSCRDNPLPTSARGTGARGLTVIQDIPPDLFIMFSTAPGNKAEDGVKGKRNSPFTEAFLKHVKSTEPLTIMAVHVANETLFLTEQRQRPFYRGSIISDAYYSLNPAKKAPEQVAQVRPAPQPAPAPSQPAQQPQPAPKPEPAPKPTPSQPAPKPTPAPKPKPAPKPPRQKISIDLGGEDQLWSAGASLGTAFSAPWIIGTVHGTIAPFKYSFFDVGLDFGLVSGKANVGYFSVYPFVHYAFFLPFAEKYGWYVGGGAGYMFANYTYSEGKITDNTFAVDLSTGVILWNMLNVSYTFKTNFKSAANKIAVGYVKRFM